MSSSMHRSTSTIAGRLTMPPVAAPSSPGTKEAESSLGSWKPKRWCSSSLKYPLHPTATAETATPYSSSTHPPTRIAAPSPSA